MGHEELKEIGINAYGHRHKLIKGVERLLGGQQGKLFGNKTVKSQKEQVSCQGWHLSSGGLNPERMHSAGVAPPACPILVTDMAVPLAALASRLLVLSSPLSLYTLNISGIYTSVCFPLLSNLVQVA